LGTLSPSPWDLSIWRPKQWFEVVEIWKRRSRIYLHILASAPDPVLRLRPRSALSSGQAIEDPTINPVTYQIKPTHTEQSETMIR